MLHITSAQHVSDYKLWVSFDDGSSGEVDLAGSLSGLIFEHLKDVMYFSKVSVDPELETITWPNSRDFAPEFVKALHNKQLKADS